MLHILIIHSLHMCPKLLYLSLFLLNSLIITLSIILVGMYYLLLLELEQQDGGTLNTITPYHQLLVQNSMATMQNPFMYMKIHQNKLNNLQTWSP